MECLKYNKNNEDFISNLDFPNCEIHKKLYLEFVCLEEKCKYSRKPLCSFCFKQNHDPSEMPHTKYEIRNLLCYFLENQNCIFNKDELLKSVPFYNEIPEKLSLIESKIIELQKMKSLLLELRNHIDQRLEAYAYFDGNLKNIIQKENEKNNLSSLLEKFMKIVGKNGPHSLTISEFSEDERGIFIEKLENINKIIDCKDLKLQITNSFIFDSSSKAEDIIIINHKNSKRISEKNSEQRFSFFTPKLTKQSKILLKVKNLSNWIGLGIAKYDFIRKNSFKFLYNKAPAYQRGYYLISSNGYCWSDSDENVHRKELSFKFTTGDLISVIYDPEKNILVFEDVKNAEKTILKIQPALDDFYVFVVNLCGTHDEIQILD